MPCFAVPKKKIEAHVETKNKKLILVIGNVKVSEIKAIIDFIEQLREKKSL